ncbi:hypothetical protein GCM10022403_057210 [Streptomyces coacervatus]|uniref:Uncharacterized protein n=1 Tax=Streptomyces coacervatus TaxID=647381 RepID=A0ABP7IEG6_9ACTN
MQIGGHHPGHIQRAQREPGDEREVCDEEDTPCHTDTDALRVKAGSESAGRSSLVAPTRRSRKCRGPAPLKGRGGPPGFTGSALTLHDPLDAACGRIGSGSSVRTCMRLPPHRYVSRP